MSSPKTIPPMPANTIDHQPFHGTPSTGTVCQLSDVSAKM